MLSLIRLFFDDSTIVVKRIPGAKALRASQLGWTVAFSVVIIDLLLVNHGLSVWGTVLFGIWFALVTYYARFLVILQIILLYLLVALDYASFFHLTAAGVAMKQSSFTYFAGFLAGGFLALVYNDLVYVFIHLCEKKKVKVAFVVDRTQQANIVKSPNEEEETALLAYLKPLRYYVAQIRKGQDVAQNAEKITTMIRATRTSPGLAAFDREEINRLLGPYGADLNTQLNALKAQLNSLDDGSLDLVSGALEPFVERRFKLKTSKLYNFEITRQPKQPYTIVLAANPYMQKRRKDADPEFKRDPILKDYRLFLDTVYRIITSFERDPLLGRPEILGRIRFVTVFPNLELDELSSLAEGDLAMIEEFPEELFDSSGERIDNRLLKPTAGMMASIDNVLKAQLDAPIAAHEIDLVYGITASPTHDRAYARYCDWKVLPPEEPLPDTVPEMAGKPFTFNPRPHAIPSEETEQTHDYYSLTPGLSAVNANVSTHYTFLHEFGHAMSSLFNGAVVDEYSDSFVVKDPPRLVTGFAVNRRERDYDPSDLSFKGVPKEFAVYNNNLFFSEMDAPSAEEEWLGYFPERAEPEIYCTMDRYYGYHRYDPLTSSFIYDRLIAKFAREKRLEITISSMWDGTSASYLFADFSITFVYLKPTEPLTPPEISDIQRLVKIELEIILEKRFNRSDFDITIGPVAQGSITVDVSITMPAMATLFDNIAEFKADWNAFSKDLEKSGGPLESGILGVVSAVSAAHAAETQKPKEKPTRK